MSPRKCHLIILFALLLLAIHDVASDSEEVTDEESEDDCCSEGELWAESGCSPTDPDPDRTQACVDTGTACCQKMMAKEREDCQKGIQMAKDTNNCDDAEEKTVGCCEQCKIGLVVGESKGCGSPKSNDPFYACCEYVMSKAETSGTPDEEEDTSPPKTETPQQKGVMDGCEVEGDSVCAHKCIPTDRSYRCQCRTGFRLRPDGFSCQKLDHNRCEINNPCEQKCTDTGDAVVCSCRRGYELMMDNVSCIDIDECELQSHDCRSGTTCLNTPGSFRCMAKSSDPKSPASSRNAGTRCPIGFFFDKRSQVCNAPATTRGDVDECKENPCPSGLVCANTIGSFSCGHSPAPPPAPAAPQRAPTQQVQPSARENPPREDAPQVPDDCPPGFKINEELADCVDIDECKESTDDCNRKSQFCLNTNGMFTCLDKASKNACPPGFKTRPDVGCEDIDECAENPDICTPGSVCVNEPGGYDCKVSATGGPKPIPRPQIPRPSPARPNPSRPTRPPAQSPPRSSSACPMGYRKSYNGGCEDINECRERTHSCDKFQQCHNIMGGHRCVCKPGFTKDPVTLACVDINECQKDSQNDCTENQRCDNTIGSYHCVRYISCGTGYTLNSLSSTCEDDDECVLGTDDCSQMGTMFECVNLPGTYRCRRKKVITTTTPAIEYDSDEYYTDDEMEAIYAKANAKANAPSKADTENTNSNSINEQESESLKPSEPSTEPPPEPTEQTIQPDTPAPKPDPRYYNQPESLKPTEDRPETRYNPNPRYNQPRTPEIEPKPEPEPNKEEEEVLPKPHLYYPNPSIPRRPYVDPRESRPVVPRIESIPAPAVVDPPVTMVGNPDNDGNIVIDTKDLKENTWTKLIPGEKHCISGYYMDSSKQCVDVDECKTGRHACAPYSEVCRNTLGAYTCLCAPGFTKETKTGLCKNDAPPAPVVPKWSPAPSKVCDVGFHVDPITRQCVDINECLEGGSRCSTNEVCVNTMGGFRCQCSPGFVLVSDRCVLPTPPVVSRQRPPVRVVTVTSSPRYNYCSWGYHMEGGRCVDVDECAADKHSCQANQKCVNIPGGYLCHCSPGHRVTPDGGCQDIDECTDSQGKVCSHYATCVNTVGSFRCDCHAGFVTSPVSKQLCTDVDECQEDGGGGLCHQKCVNIWGSYRCACDNGFRLASDNRTCLDINECTEHNRRLCMGECQNVPGSYQCTCPKGYRMGSDKGSCIDIDECENGELACEEDQVCQNTRGGARCSSIACPIGYNRDPGTRHRCRRPPGTCRVNDYSCLHQPETYSFNFITFVSKLYIPSGPRSQVDLFTMRGPNWQEAMLRFQLRLVEVRAAPGVETATMGCFKLTPSPQQALVSLVKPLIGPQDIHLELSMELYRLGNFEGTAVAKIFIYVSEYEF